MTETTEAITVAICTYERHHLIKPLVEAVLAQDVPGGAKITIIDNSTDQDAATRFYTEAKLDKRINILRSTPPGLSRARNLAVMLCTTPYIAFIDDDALPEPGWLAGLVEGFAAGPRVGVVGGPIDPVWPDGARPDWLSKDLEPLLSRLDAGADPCELPAGDHVFGANFALCVAATQDVPGFAEQLGRTGDGTLMSCEELEVQDRMRQAGWSVRYAPTARVRHAVHADRLRRNWIRERMAWQAVSQMLQDPPSIDRQSALATLRRLSLELDLAPALHRLFADAPPAVFERQVEFIHALLLTLLSARQSPESELRTLCEPEETSQLREALRRLELENETLRGGKPRALAGPDASPGLGARLRRAWFGLLVGRD